MESFSRACILVYLSLRCHRQGSLVTVVRRVREGKLTLFRTYILSTLSSIRVRPFSGYFMMQLDVLNVTWNHCSWNLVEVSAFFVLGFVLLLYLWESFLHLGFLTFFSSFKCLSRESYNFLFIIFYCTYWCDFVHMPSRSHRVHHMSFSADLFLLEL